MNHSIHPQYPSIKLDQLVYVELPSNNGGMMLSVSEEGFSFRAVAPIQPGAPIPFSFATNGFDKLAGYGRIEWIDDEGKVAGLQFTDVSAEFKSSLRRWLKQMSAPGVASFEASGPKNPTGKLSNPPSAPESKKSRVSEFAKVLGSVDSAGSLPAPANVLPEGASPLRDTTFEESQSSDPKLALPMFREWEYPRELESEARPATRRIAVWSAGIVVAVLALVFFGYREFVGQSLITLGHHFSAPSVPPPAETGANYITKPTPKQEQPSTGNEPKSQSASPDPGLPTTGGSRPVSQLSRPENSLKNSHFVDSPPARPLELRDQHAATSEQSHVLWSAVSHGDTTAEVTLAKLYLIGGNGVAKNCVQARILLQAAAKKGNGTAIDKLAQINREGCP